MSLANDLLSQARTLAINEPRRPKQASLRRAVSAAYYAIFHLLVEDAARQLATANPAGLREKIRRAFAHTEMKKVCRDFARTKNHVPPDNLKTLLSTRLSPELISVAGAFVDLQEARHRADYDLSVDLTRAEALSHVQKAEAALSAWRTQRETSDAKVFLTALLLNDRWHKG